MEAEVNFFIITSRDPLGKFVLFLCATLGSVYLGFLVFKGEMLPPGDTAKAPLNFRLLLSSDH